MLDKFVTWGWSDKRNDKIVKGIATKLNSRKKKVSRNYKDILFATTVFSRFRTTFRYAVCGFAKQYQGDQIEFLSCINKDIILNLILRPHYFDAGWDTNKMITDFDSSIRFQTWDVKFQKALKECKIYVCDHLSTTFIEALYINKPTILFWRDSNHELKPEAVNYYENLKRVGILHSNPRAAAEVLNEIYEDVETWWNNHERQIAVREFCDNFAYVPPNSLEIFGEILLK
jgi:putative transferase (TIGR04331 family)